MTGAIKKIKDPKSDYDVFSDRLIESLNMVRELLLSNKNMREQQEETNERIDGLQQEMILYQKENMELREKLNELDNNEE